MAARRKAEADELKEDEVARRFVQIHAWVRREELTALKRLAAQRDQSISAVIRSLLRRVLPAQE